MERKNTPSLWQTARVETSTLGVLVVGWVVSNVMGWVPDVNASLVALAVYAAWLLLCIIVYRVYYRLDT